MTGFAVRQVESVFPRLLDRATCVTCGGRPRLDHVEAIGAGARVYVTCHGEAESVAVLSLDRDLQWAMDFPRRFFLRRVASTGAMSNDARRERRNRLRECT